MKKKKLWRSALLFIFVVGLTLALGFPTCDVKAAQKKTIKMEYTKLIKSEIASDLVPGPVEYAVLLPSGYENSDEKYPLVYLLHGGGGSRDFLERMRPLLEAAMQSGKIPKAVFATPSASRLFYMDTKDGLEKWEQFLIEQFLDHLRSEYKVKADRDNTFLSGISMGGLGSLRLALKYPEIFAGVAALEPGIEPALSFSDIKPEDRFWRSDELFEKIFGKPVDNEYWMANNPANIAKDNASKIISSGLAIYIECGNQDSFGLHRGTEFLHRILWDNQIPHEYHLVQGADHLGSTIGPRFEEALTFLGKAMKPKEEDPIVTGLHKMIAQMKRRAEKILGVKIK